MAGASITLLELDDELTALWDAPVHTPALRWGRAVTDDVDAATVRRWLEGSAAAAARAARLPDAARRGDRRRAITERTWTAASRASSRSSPSSTARTPPGRILVAAGSTLVSTVGGASGPLWGTALRRAGRASGMSRRSTRRRLRKRSTAALDGVVELGAAQPGDKTMVDALEPAVRTLRGATRRRLAPTARPSPQRARLPRRECGRRFRCRRRRDAPPTSASGASDIRIRVRPRPRLIVRALELAVAAEQ